MILNKHKYHVALDDMGLILQGAPRNPAYVVEPAPVYQNRFAQGDRTYDDFAKWWFWAQTDWFQGFKDSPSWADDGKFYLSVNIDTFTEQGTFQLLPGTASENDFTIEISCGSYEEAGGTVYKYVGTFDNTSSKPVVFRKNLSWDDISSTWMPTSQNVIADILGHKGKIWIATVGTGNTHVLVKADADGTNEVDYSLTLMGTGVFNWNGISAANAIWDDGNTIYVACYSISTGDFGIAKSSDNGSTWSKVVSFTGSFMGNNTIPCGITASGRIFYLINRSYGLELRQFTLSSSTDISLYKFYSHWALANWGSSRKFLHLLGSKVIITVPDKEIWSLDLNDGTLERIYVRDNAKNNLGVAARINLTKGGIMHNNKIYWDNLVYDGSRFYNGKLGPDENTALYPIFSDGSVIYWAESGSSVLLKDDGYKSTADKNYLIFSQFDKVAGVNKLAYAVTILFKPLVSGQSISVEYLTGELTLNNGSWKSLGTASHAVDGGSVTEKTFYLPENTTFKKIWIRVKLLGGGSNTPGFKDFIMEYLPLPVPDKRWRININAANDIEDLSGEKLNQSGREIYGKLQLAWLRNRILDFQDIDFATCYLTSDITNSATTMSVDDTSDFPEQGRIRLNDEIMYYTGKTPTSFTGLVRGQKNTRAAAHTASNNGTGTISCDNSIFVTGTGTAFTTQLVVGAKITVSGVTRKVAKIISDTSLELEAANGVTWTGAAFTYLNPVHNAYKVLVQSISSQVPLLEYADHPQSRLEYVVGVVLREVI